MKNRTRPTARLTARPTAARPIRPVLKNLRFQETSHCSTASVFKRAPSTPDPVSKTPASPPDRRPPDRLPDRPFDQPNTQELPISRQHPLLNGLRVQEGTQYSTDSVSKRAPNIQQTPLQESIH